MNGENIKKVYILNLDKTRISIVSGIFLIALSFAFLLGLKFQKSPVVVPSAEISNSSPDMAMAPKNTTGDIPLRTLPDEDTKIFNDTKSEDPFLIEPPEKTSLAKSTHALEKPEIKKDSKTLKTIKKQDKPEIHDRIEAKAYYTIQVGAYSHEKDAKAIAEKIRKKGIDARVEKGKMYYFVRVGKSEKKDALEPVYQKLMDNLQIKAFIVQKKNS